MEHEDILEALPSGDAADEAAIEGERRRAAARIALALEAQLGSLPAQDRLMLRLRFEDGRTVSQMAAIMRLEQKPLYRRLERLLRELRTGLEDRGVSRAEVQELLGDALIEVPGGGSGGETGGGRPSISRGAEPWP